MQPFETIKSGVAGIAEKVLGEDPKLLTAATKMIRDMPDGVSGLLKQFQDHGLGSLVTNLQGKAPVEVTPQQITQGFSKEQIASLSKASGLESKQVIDKLATILPKLVNQLR